MCVFRRALLALCTVVLLWLEVVFCFFLRHNSVLLCSLPSARWDVDGHGHSAWRRFEYVRGAHENDAGRKGFLRHVLPHLLRARRTERGGRGRPPWPTVSTKRVVRSSLIGNSQICIIFCFHEQTKVFCLYRAKEQGPLRTD